MTLARTKPENLVKTGEAMKQSLKRELGFEDNFLFHRD